MDFTADGEVVKLLSSVATGLGVPLTEVLVPKEKHAREIWGLVLVLLRPDGHLAWRCASDGGGPALDENAMKDILLVDVGKKESLAFVPYKEELISNEEAEMNRVVLVNA